MKICVINNLYKPFNRGGAEKVMETIIAGLRDAGHKVFIITTNPRFGNFKLENENLDIYHINSSYYNLNKFSNYSKFFWHILDVFNFVSYFKIKKILRSERCDAVITNNLMGVGFLTPMAVGSLKIKHLHIVHDIQLIHPSGLMYYGEEGIIDNFFAKLYSNVCRRLFAGTPAVIFPSRWLKDFYLKRNFFAQSKIQVLPNPVESALAQAGERPGNFKFLFLGQIEKHKGIFLLINAFNRLKEKYPEVELLIAGDGSQLERAHKLAAENENIKFLGWLGGEAAAESLNSSHCLVYPSLVYENCPNAIQRAIVAGLPVLASDLGGIPELLNKNTGKLFKPADEKDLVEKMSWMIENRNNLNNLGEAGQRQVAVFKTENYIKVLIDYFLNI